jgi:hypothetical protein
MDQARLDDPPEAAPPGNAAHRQAPMHDDVVE